MSTLSLHDLPTEVLESILVVQPPATVCAVACASRALRDAVSPVVWRSNTVRTLRVPADSAAETRSRANSLVCAWWAASGALVRGVPVHFRRGFVGVRQRGAASLVRIRSASEDAALVLGAPDDAHGSHSPKPSLEMDFALNEAGPFPVDGMMVRVVGAPVPHSPPSPPSSPLARSPSSRPILPWAPLARSPPGSPTFGVGGPRLPRASQLRAEGARQRDVISSISSDDEASATVRVVINGTEIGTHTVSEQCAFKHVDLFIPSSLLRCKPKMNTILVEYIEAESTASYWLKEVRVVPKILPLANFEVVENIPLRHVGRSSHGMDHAHKGEHGSTHKPRRGTAAAFSLDRIMGC